ncbi:unnamed protein product, partial [Discosporangium mesarthrocarpum]
HRAGASSGPVGVVRDVDSISNAVCSVIDASDFIRNAHSKEEFRDAADRAFSGLAETGPDPYEQDLNTDVNLYRALCGLAGDERAMETLTPEQRRVVGLHKAEYERGGIHLGADERCRRLL